MNNENNQADLLFVLGFLYYACSICTASLHIKDTGMAGNVMEFRGVAICCNLENLMIARVPFHPCLKKQVPL